MRKETSVWVYDEFQNRNGKKETRLQVGINATDQSVRKGVRYEGIRRELEDEPRIGRWLGCRCRPRPTSTLSRLALLVGGCSRLVWAGEIPVLDEDGTPVGDDDDDDAEAVRCRRAKVCAVDDGRRRPFLSTHFIHLSASKRLWRSC